MTSNLVKLNGTDKNFLQNLTYFFETLKNSKHIKYYNECLFLFHESQKIEQNIIVNHLKELNITPDSCFFSKYYIPKSQHKVTVVFIPEYLDRLPIEYENLIQQQTNLVILAGENSSAALFDSIHHWSILLQDNKITLS